MLFSILASDAIALPLSPSFPALELKYILENSGTKMLLATEKYSSKAEELVSSTNAGSNLIFDIRSEIVAATSPSSVQQQQQLSGIQESKGGLMLYTSGTTNRPVRTHYHICF